MWDWVLFLSSVGWVMDVGMDNGPILTQREEGISSMDTTGSLTPKLAQPIASLGRDLFLMRYSTSSITAQQVQTTCCVSENIDYK
jgi:methionyl-tRNA formyltransferase